MIPDSTLPRETADLVEADLAPGERVAWVGQPIPGRFARISILIVLFGIPWTAFATFWTVVTGVGASTASRELGSGGFSFVLPLFPLFGLPFILVGLGMLSSPYWMIRNARRTAYVITDRRALIFDPCLFRTMSVRSFEPDRLHDLRRVQNSDGSGDLVFERQSRVDSDGDRHSRNIGFMAIARVKEVEELIRGLSATAKLRAG